MVGFLLLARLGLQNTISELSVSTKILRPLSKVSSESFSSNSRTSSGEITIRGSVCVDFSSVVTLLMSVFTCLETVFCISLPSSLSAIFCTSSSSSESLTVKSCMTLDRASDGAFGIGVLLVDGISVGA